MLIKNYFEIEYRKAMLYKFYIFKKTLFITLIIILKTHIKSNSQKEKNKT